MVEKGKKVFVGLSGGVDSSVSAVLLKEQGYDVSGVFIKVWQPEFIKCDWREDRLDAMRICAKLDIPFLDLDLEEEYKKEVFDYMITEYKEGRTPNPDVMCNKNIKFGGFLKFALGNGADYVATGHYARLKKREFSTTYKHCEDGPRNVESFSIFNKLKLLWCSTEYKNDKFLIQKHTFNHSIECMKYQLLAGKDKNKDQSYFLWTLTQEQLKHILFPIGHLEKPEVRKLAKKFDLLTAEKKDSQGLCFIGQVEMKDFLKRFLPEKKGNVLNEEGEAIGTHDGAYYYTFGQRHGFLITKKTPEDKPYFVVDKDVEKNTITVAKELRDRKEINIVNVNWISGEPESGKIYLGRIRYRQSLQKCRVEKNKVVFEEPQKAVSPGQSLVLYDEDVCLGGGVIE